MAESSLPSWLNTTFMESGLRKAFKNEKLKVLKLEASVANAAGDHYGSQMYRFKLIIQTTPETEESCFVVAKVLPPTKLAEERLIPTIFKTEGKAFEDALPCIHLQLEKAFPGMEKLWAEFYFCQEEPNMIIVLKDLKCDGYTICKRTVGLDLEHTTWVLKCLAKLHAASIPAIKAHPEKFKRFDWCFWTLENKDVFGKFFEAPFAGFLKDLPNWPEFEGKDMYIKRLTAIKETFIEEALKGFIRDDSKLRVFLHVDSWTNNFMFKYGADGEKPIGIKLVDFQISCVNSPALDIMYLIFTSVRPDLKFDQIDYFLETYYATFEDTLKRLGHKLDIPFGLKELKRDFEEKYAWGFAVFTCFSTLSTAPPDFQFNEFYEEEKADNFAKLFRGNDIREVIMRGLKFFSQKGIL